jgi:hypothetical protein
VDASRNSSALIPASPRDNDALQRKIVLDEIETLLVLHFPSTSGADKKAKLELLRRHFHAAWVESREAVVPPKIESKDVHIVHTPGGPQEMLKTAPADPARRKMGRPLDPRWRGPEGTFDRTAYQREYQRKRRAAAKAGGSV